MEITTTNIYWLFVVLPSIREVIVVLAVGLSFVSIISGFIGALSWEYETDDWKKKYKKGISILLALIILVFFVQALIPTKQDLVLMYGLPRALNNENVQELPDNAVKYINTWLEQNTESLEEEK